jgi:ferredoxin
MPKVIAQRKTIECEPSANLRQVLLKNNIDLYNGAATTINCHGLGTCGTCAVSIEGEVSAMSWREKTRLSLPPHALDSDRRLACQVQVLGDIRVTKYNGFWGHGTQVEWTPDP